MGIPLEDPQKGLWQQEYEVLAEQYFKRVFEYILDQGLASDQTSGIEEAFPAVAPIAITKDAGYEKDFAEMPRKEQKEKTKELKHRVTSNLGKLPRGSYRIAITQKLAVRKRSLTRC